MVGITQIEPGLGEEAVDGAGTVCERSGAGVHAAAFCDVVPVSALCAGTGPLCGEMGVVSALR
jgi:hypothetical protein